MIQERCWFSQIDFFNDAFPPSEGCHAQHLSFQPLVFSRRVLDPKCCATLPASRRSRPVKSGTSSALGYIVRFAKQQQTDDLFMAFQPLGSLRRRLSQTFSWSTSDSSHLSSCFGLERWGVSIPSERGERWFRWLCSLERAKITGTGSLLWAVVYDKSHTVLLNRGLMKIVSRASRPGFLVDFLRILWNGHCTAQSFRTDVYGDVCRIGCRDGPDPLTRWNE